MTVTIQFPRALTRYSGGADSMESDAKSVSELLAALKRRWPDVYSAICDETGTVRPHIHLFRNNDLLTTDRFSSVSLSRGDVLSVFTAVSGG